MLRLFKRNTNVVPVSEAVSAQAPVIAAPPQEVEIKSPLYGAVEFLDRASNSYGNAGSQVDFPSSHTEKEKVVAFSKSQRNETQFYGNLASTEEALMNTKVYGTRLEGLAKRLEADLADIRAQNEAGAFLTQHEQSVLGYMSGFTAHVQGLVEGVRVLSATDLDKIENEGYFNPKDREYAGGVFERMVAMRVGLRRAKERTEGLLDLEKKVDKLTEAYVNL